MRTRPQQAVEKSLKALVTWHGKEFPKIHDLLRLLDLALPLHPQLDDFREQLADMSGFAVESRYPGEGADPSYEEAAAALKIAEKFYDMISSLTCGKA